MTNPIPYILDRLLGPTRYWVAARTDDTRVVVESRWQPENCTRFSAMCGGSATCEYAQSVADDMNAMRTKHGWVDQ